MHNSKWLNDEHWLVLFMFSFKWCSAHKRKCLTKICGHCSIAQGQKFWTLFQCTGTKIFGPCSSAQGRKLFGHYSNDKFSTLFHAKSWKGTISQLSFLLLLSFHEYVYVRSNVNIDDQSVHSTFNIDWSIGFWLTMERFNFVVHPRLSDSITSWIDNGITTI